MAIRKKKIRSFSPYEYNVQYFKPGKGPVQVPRPYVRTASVTENEYVVTKVEPKNYTFLENYFYYTVDDDCTINLNSTMSVFKIRHDMLVSEYEECVVLEDVFYHIKIDVVNNTTLQYVWKDRRTLNVNHNLNSMVDGIILLRLLDADNKEYFQYLRFSQTMYSKNNIDINFDRNIGEKCQLTIILYPLKSNTNFLDNIITKNEYTYDQLTINEMSNSIVALKNDFGNTNLIPMIFDSNNKTYLLEKYDITPSYLLFPNNLFKLINSNIDIEDFLDFSNKKKFDIEKVVLYYINRPFSLYNIFRNISNNTIIWKKSKNNDEDICNCVEVRHNLNGNVIVIFDSEKYYDYTLYKMDNDTILIEFLSKNNSIITNDEVPISFSLRLYKVD